MIDEAAVITFCIDAEAFRELAAGARVPASDCGTRRGNCGSAPGRLPISYLMRGLSGTLSGAEIEHEGIVVTGVASYVKVAASTEDDVVLGALVAALDFAADVGAPAVRVFPGAPAERTPYDRVPRLLEPREEADTLAAVVNPVAEYASERRVVVALETHGAHPLGGRSRRSLPRWTDRRAISDLMHPWRIGERLEHTSTAYAHRCPQRGSVQITTPTSPKAPHRCWWARTLPTAEFAEPWFADLRRLGHVGMGAGLASPGRTTGRRLRVGPALGRLVVAGRRSQHLMSVRPQVTLAREDRAARLDVLD